MAKLTFKVSPKGGLSVYGLQRFPVTLYREQWIDLLGASAELLAYLEEHAADFSTNQSGHRLRTSEARGIIFDGPDGYGAEILKSGAFQIHRWEPQRGCYVPIGKVLAAKSWAHAIEVYRAAV